MHVWIGYATDPGAFAALRSARRVWGNAITITASDSLPAHECSAALEADAYVRLPDEYEPGFVDELLQGLADRAPDVYLTTLEPELLIVARLRESGRWPDTTAALVPSRKATLMCADKLMMAQLLEALELPTPPTAVIGEAAWDERGMVVKRRNGWGSAGLQVIEDEQTFAEVAGFNLIAQPRLEPPELAIDAFRSKTGRTRAIVREGLSSTGGIEMRARVFEDPDLEASAARLGAALGLTGAYVFQTLEGQITDVNPRPGSGMGMSIAAGFDPIAATFAEAFGEDPWQHVGPLARECFVTREYIEYVH